MWVIYAFLSALFASLTAVISKIGVNNIKSNVATFIRTIVVLIFAWIIVFICGSYKEITNIDNMTLLFLCLSGIATGASWLCYFRALQLGNVNKVTPIDKSSTVLTMLLAFILLGEKITTLNLLSIVLISIGTYLMIEKNKKDNQNVKSNNWIIFAFLSAIFASLTAILAKIGISNIDSNLGTAIRTIVVLIMSFMVICINKESSYLKLIDKKSLYFLIFSGVTTGLSWLCYFKALQDGLISVVVPIDKLSIVGTIIFSYLFLKEKLNKKSIIGLLLIISGTMLLLIK